MRHSCRCASYTSIIRTLKFLEVEYAENQQSKANCGINIKVSQVFGIFAYLSCFITTNYKLKIKLI